MLREVSHLDLIRQGMIGEKIDIMLVRSTDKYFNEYVAPDQSDRVFATGFTGSMGDAIITKDRALLFVDGRYRLQSRNQSPHFDVRVIPNTVSIEEAWLDELTNLSSKEGSTLSIDTTRISIGLFQKIQKLAKKSNLIIRTTKHSLVQKLREQRSATSSTNNFAISKVPQEICGQSVGEKLRALKPFFDEKKVDALLITPLDEIAWITNLRGTHFPFQATFGARAIALRDRIIVGFENHALSCELPKEIISISEKHFFDLVSKELAKNTSVAVDPRATSQCAYDDLKTAGLGVVETKNPLGELKSIKNGRELDHMLEAFALADSVAYKTQKWLCEEISNNAPSEASVHQFVTQAFFDSGANALSFSPICASGENAAQIHYGGSDNANPISEGSLFLLDVGGYYRGGYATDLTRTFLVAAPGKCATSKQKHLYTTVLKGAIAGLSARFPIGTTGAQLDAIVRNPIWQEGLDYEHGTGHGVGINVHERPPSISQRGVEPIKKGQVFSIEPGVYIENFGGIRIENLATAIDDPDIEGYLRVIPLTFAPLDDRLIERSKLTNKELSFLDFFAKSFDRPKGVWPKLPNY